MKSSRPGLLYAGSFLNYRFYFTSSIQSVQVMLLFDSILAGLFFSFFFFFLYFCSIVCYFSSFISYFVYLSPPFSSWWSWLEVYWFLFILSKKWFYWPFYFFLISIYFFSDLYYFLHSAYLGVFVVVVLFLIILDSSLDCLFEIFFVSWGRPVLLKRSPFRYSD